MKKGLITGASSGLGRALAVKLAEERIPLLLTGRNKEALIKLQRSLPVETQILACDLKDPEPLLKMIEQEAPDLLVNCADFGLYGDLLDHSITSQVEILKVNGIALLKISYAARFFPQKKDHYQMSPEKAGETLLRQIKKKKRLSIFDRRYRFLVFCARYLIPSKWVENRIRQTALNRMGSTSF